MFNFNIYNEAYAKIGNLTPISADCGVLCSARCCKGGEDAGMILFPGEEVFLKNKSFVKLTQRDMCGYRVWFAVCNGACPRANRPLSCRIFPLSPRYEDGKLTIEFDPRARTMCPLFGADAVEEKFTRAVNDVFVRLIASQDVREMLDAYTKMQNEYRVFMPE